VEKREEQSLTRREEEQSPIRKEEQSLQERLDESLESLDEDTNLSNIHNLFNNIFIMSIQNLAFTKSPQLISNIIGI
jgi:hypothetical protein